MMHELAPFEPSIEDERRRQAEGVEGIGMKEPRLIRLADVGKFEESVLEDDGLDLAMSTESPPERNFVYDLRSELARLIDRGCLPSDTLLEPQRWVTAGGRRYRLDFVISRGSTRLAVECDGWRYHRATREQIERDRDRDERLRAAGFEVDRILARDILRDGRFHAERVFRRLLWMLARNNEATRRR